MFQKSRKELSHWIPAPDQVEGMLSPACACTHADRREWQRKREWRSFSCHSVLDAESGKSISLWITQDWTDF